MAASDTRRSLDHPHLPGDVETAKREENHEAPDNAEILRKSWSKKALIVAYTGSVLALS